MTNLSLAPLCLQAAASESLGPMLWNLSSVMLCSWMVFLQECDVYDFIKDGQRPSSLTRQPARVALSYTAILYRLYSDRTPRRKITASKCKSCAVYLFLSWIDGDLDRATTARDLNKMQVSVVSDRYGILWSSIPCYEFNFGSGKAICHGRWLHS